MLYVIFQNINKIYWGFFKKLCGKVAKYKPDEAIGRHFSDLDSIWNEISRHRFVTLCFVRLLRLLRVIERTDQEDFWTWLLFIIVKFCFWFTHFMRRTLFLPCYPGVLVKNKEVWHIENQGHLWTVVRS